MNHFRWDGWLLRTGVRSGRHATGCARRPLLLEQLEDRSLLAASTLASAPVLDLVLADSVHVRQFLASDAEHQLFAVTAAAGDQFRVDLDSQTPGSALNSYLRVFDAAGTQIAANDDFTGPGAGLTFQAPSNGVYYLGISSTGNMTYNPVDGSGDVGGDSAGLYDLIVHRTHAALQPDLVGAAFEMSSEKAIAGDVLTISYRIENRGGKTTGTGFQVAFLLSGDNRIDSSDVALLTREVGTLQAGESFAETLTVSVSDAATLPGALAAGGVGHVGMIVDAANGVAELDETNNAGQRADSDREELRILAAVDSAADNADPGRAQIVDANSRIVGVTVLPDEERWYRLNLPPGNGQLTLEAASDGGTVLTLLIGNADASDPLVSSAGLPGQDLLSQIVEHVDGSFPLLVRVTSRSEVPATFTLDVVFEPAVAPFGSPGSVALSDPAGVVDLNGDGSLDRVTAGGVVTIGLADGTFGFPPGAALPPGLGTIQAVAVGDFNSDRIPDLVAAITAAPGLASLAILPGFGDGTFLAPITLLDSGTAFDKLLAVDVSGDGLLDVAAVELAGHTITVFRNNGDGSFSRLAPIGVGMGSSPPPIAQLATGDFNNDGYLDFAACGGTEATGSVAILLNDSSGQATFHAQTLKALGASAEDLYVEDFDGDGKVDVAIAASVPSGVLLLRGIGDGSLADVVSFATGTRTSNLTAGDFNNDGLLDVVAYNRGSNDVSVLLNNGKGGFLPEKRVPVSMSTGAARLARADVTEDGNLDLLGGSFLSSALLPGRGDGTFQLPPTNHVGGTLGTTVIADFNNDGRPDMAASSGEPAIGGEASLPGELVIFISNGDGSFQDAFRSQTAPEPLNMVAGDFNGDGRLDLVAADRLGGTLDLRLGLGTGQFADTIEIPVPAGPFALAADDFDGDGKIDLAVGSVLTNTVAILRNDGHAHFSVLGPVLSTGSLPPQKLFTGDFDGNGVGDLAVLESRSFLGTQAAQGLDVFLRNADGSLRVPPIVLVNGVQVGVPTVGDFNGDGFDDLAWTTTMNSPSLAVTVHIVHGHGTGALTEDQTIDAQQFPGVTVTGGDLSAVRFRSSTSVIGAPFNGQVPLDLLFVSSAGTIAVLDNNGDGTFAGEMRALTANFPGGIAAISEVAAPGLMADFNQDGNPDLIVRTARGQAEVYLQTEKGDDPLSPAGSTVVPPRSIPLLADIDGDGVQDVVQIDRLGDVLFRQGIPGSSISFASAAVINAGRPAADATLVQTPRGLRLAVLERDGGGSLYAWDQGLQQLALEGPAGIAFSAGSLPSRLIVGDFNGDGVEDLVVLSAGSGMATLLAGQNDGRFLAPVLLSDVGIGVADGLLANLGGGADTLVVSGQVSGTVRTVGPDSEGEFRAGLGISSLAVSVADEGLQPVIQSQELTSGQLVGDFTGDAVPDLLAVNAGSNSVGLLTGLAGGTFLNPLLTQLAATPTAAAAGFLDANGSLDVAIVSRATGTVIIFLNDGTGGFAERPSPRPLLVDPTASGIRVADVNADGKRDLLVGNDFGDLLIFLGNGDGTFAPLRNARRTPLAVADINGDGTADALLADQAQDRVIVRTRDPGSPTFTDVFTDGPTNPVLFAPGAVVWKDLNNDGWLDAIVAAGGSNSILVYQNSPAGFRPATSYFVGTNPAAMLFAEMNGDGVPDVAVSNAGSNDISILFGTIVGGEWTARPGPRLLGGPSPGKLEMVDVDIRAATGNPGDPTLDGIPDLVVVNNSAGTVRVLPGVGNGFFSDVNPETLNLGAPIRDVSGNFALLSGGQIVRFDLSTQAVTTLFTDVRGGTVLQAVAVAGQAFPVLFTANADGTVSALVSSNGVGYSEAAFQGSAALDDPSALEVLTDLNGQFEVYVTNSGTDGLIVLRFGLDELVAGLVPIDSSAPLAVVVTLTNSLLVDNLAAEGVGLGEALAVFASEEVAGNLPAEDGRLLSVGERLLSGIEETMEEFTVSETGSDETLPETLEEFIGGIDEVLKRMKEEQSEELPVPERGGTEELEWNGDAAAGSALDGFPYGMWESRSAEEAVQPIRGTEFPSRQQVEEHETGSVLSPLLTSVVFALALTVPELHTGPSCLSARAPWTPFRDGSHFFSRRWSPRCGSCHHRSSRPGACRRD